MLYESINLAAPLRIELRSSDLESLLLAFAPRGNNNKIHLSILYSQNISNLFAVCIFSFFTYILYHIFYEKSNFFFSARLIFSFCSATYFFMILHPLQPFRFLQNQQSSTSHQAYRGGCGRTFLLLIDFLLLEIHINFFP